MDSEGLVKEDSRRIYKATATYLSHGGGGSSSQAESRARPSSTTTHHNKLIFDISPSEGTYYFRNCTVKS